MNTLYLMQYIANLLNTNVYKYTLEGIPLEQTSSHQDGLTKPAVLESFLLEACSQDIPIILAADKHQRIYCAVTIPKFIFLVGPVYVKTPLRFLHHLPMSDGNSEATVPVSECDLDSLVQALLLLRNLFCKVPLNENVVFSHNFIEAQMNQNAKKHFSDLIFQNQEAGEMHNPYDQEVREFNSIRNGDIKQLEQSWREHFNGQYGVLAKDELRAIKNICIVVITLASRAAIEGGVSPEIAYSLSDSYIYQIEELSDPQTITYLCREAEYEYTQMVQDIKKQKRNQTSKNSNHPRISQCKDYIFKHLHEKIYIKDIAAALNTNANYLAELFIRSEGISISSFIIQEKVNLAKNLLVYSKYSYSEIAANLAFCSQSHFGKHFKEVTNLTPKQYREAFGVR
ncbi:helix-turn-helix domain-containing protein [Paenibacillus lentus]|uniref:Helix-turn-helix domain-containing protein n=1 Tax=Paenibacillus lentus TaxID=1338368 RepID=A0A3S8RWU8_9BACL|nr:helix-turn-helix domain-containing protein [Paenibacillus lentus]AZK47551.1 helix-turn-helix domain-containing protein [Paenibacillus lentus]